MRESLKISKTMTEFLNLEFNKRKAFNPRATRSEFAAELGISIAHLSRVLRGLSGVRQERGRKIAAGLELNNEELYLFEDLISKHPAPLVTWPKKM